MLMRIPAAMIVTLAVVPGAIVAREYAIPTVTGTEIAARIIQDGQRVTVDGEAGVVLIA